MTNNNYKNYMEAINEIIVKNNNVIKELQRANMDLMNAFKSMVNAEATATTSDGLETRILCGDREQHEMVRIEFKFDSNVVTRLVYEVDEMDFKKVPNIIMSCLRNGGGTIDINIGSIEIEYFDWDGKGAILVNHDTESLVKAYNSFMHIATM